MNCEDDIKRLKREQNKTVDWIKYFEKKLKMIELKMDNIEKTLDEMKENDNIMAQHILSFHEKIVENK